MLQNEAFPAVPRGYGRDMIPEEHICALVGKPNDVLTRDEDDVRYAWLSHPCRLRALVFAPAFEDRQSSPGVPKVAGLEVVAAQKDLDRMETKATVER